MSALKIKRIIPDDENVKQIPAGGFGATVVPEEDGYEPFKISGEYIKKHKPQAGGYYVVYEDGYKSWSPAEPFESGYTKL